MIQNFTITNTKELNSYYWLCVHENITNDCDNYVRWTWFLGYSDAGVVPRRKSRRAGLERYWCSRQRHLLFYLPMIAGSVSFVCSITLMVLILKGGKGRRGQQGRRRATVGPAETLSTSVRKQLLFGLSLLDCIGSFGYIFSTLPAPSSTKRVYYDKVCYWTYSIGNTQTCTLQGFLVQFALTVPFYNAFMGIYFVLAVKYNKSDRHLLRKYGPIQCMHFFVALWIVVVQIVNLSLRLYNSSGIMGCYLSPGEPGYEIAKVSNLDTYLYAFAAAPIGFGFITCLITMAILYCAVLQVEARNRRWDFRSRNANNQQRNPPRRNNMSSLARDKGLMYSFSFILCYTPTVLIHFRNLGLFHVSWAGYEALRLLVVIFLPLQGAFNLAIYTSPKWKPYLCSGDCYKLFWYIPMFVLSMVCKCCATSVTFVANALQKCSTIVAQYTEKDDNGNRRRNASATGRTDSAGSGGDASSSAGNRRDSNSRPLSIRNLFDGMRNKKRTDEQQQVSHQGGRQQPGPQNENDNNDDNEDGDKQVDDSNRKRSSTNNGRCEDDDDARMEEFEGGFSSAFYYLSDKKIPTIEEAQKGAATNNESSSKSRLQQSIKRLNDVETPALSCEVRPLDSMASSVEVVEFEYPTTTKASTTTESKATEEEEDKLSNDNNREEEEMKEKEEQGDTTIDRMEEKMEEAVQKDEEKQEIE